MCYKRLCITRCVFSFLFLFIIQSLQGQAKISAPPNVCIGNLAYFTASSTSGIKSYKWEFGDGYTSVSQSPFHLYKKTGTFKVRVTLTLNNNSSATDSTDIVVDALPKAILFEDGPQDSCLYTNLFNFRDRSTPAKSSQTIVKRLVLWGDGDFDVNDGRNFDDRVQHHYKSKDVFSIKMEVTDNRGCKSSTIAMAKVINGTLAKIKAEISSPGCGKAQVCFSSASETSNGSRQKYTWDFDSTGFISLPPEHIKCFTTSTSKYVSARLVLSNPDNTCRSEAYRRIRLNTDSIDNVMTMSDTTICYGSAVPLEIRNSGVDYSYYWTINGKHFADGKDIDIIPKARKPELKPGRYILECRISNGPCLVNKTMAFTVKGPVAKMQIFNRKQCGVDYRVFFSDISSNLDKRHAVYNWTVIDPEGGNCVINRSKDINKFKNCNTSKDWFGKHDYTVPRYSNPIHLAVTDTSVGCSDSVWDYMKHFCCRLCFRAGGYVEICQYDTFLKLQEDEIGPEFFSLDTGRTWLKFPSVIPKPYKGVYGVSFIFKNYIEDRAEDFGDDSIKIYRDSTPWMDTLFVSDFLYVKESKSTDMTLEVHNICQPYEAIIRPKDSIFRAGDIVTINWMDGKTSTIHCLVDTIITGFGHLYRVPGIDSTISMALVSSEGCTRFKRLKIRFGKKFKLAYTGKPCKNTEICFEPVILETYDNPRLSVLKNITWKTHADDLLTQSQLCMTYEKAGQKKVTLIAEDSLGCIDTVEHAFFVRELKAGVKDGTRTFYCSELRQLFDSSAHIVKDSLDFITQYSWDFGSTRYTTLEKDPFSSFNLADSVVHVIHVVKDNNGCTDSFFFDITIIGSVPRFEFTDSMGCAPFKAEFRNLSKKCSSYIWEFDDQDNTTSESYDDKKQEFTYGKPGKFYPKLIGIDTFFNPYTGSIYYCHTTYDPNKAITVFKTLHSTLQGDDTICLGQIANFTSNSDDVMYNQWDFGDGTVSKLPVQTKITHTYKTAGQFKIKVVPQFQFPVGAPACLDSSSKNITVAGVDADFEIDEKSDAPIFYFNNRSTPSYADLSWDFGQPSSGSHNSSSAQNPSHNYGTDNGRFKVCLTATVLNRCKDVTCKILENTYVQSMKLYNVFTPGNNDSLNDEYDVEIEGEHTYLLVIYDRWGVEVYNSKTDGQPGNRVNWNGRVYNNGNECPAGTYYYVLNYSYKIDPDKEYQVNGTVTLIRN